MARRPSISANSGVRMILDGVSIIRDPDGVWCRVAPPSAHDLKDNWYRASPSLLIRWLDTVGQVTPVEPKEQ
jgi:hypothetical protein